MLPTFSGKIGDNRQVIFSIYHEIGKIGFKSSDSHLVISNNNRHI